MVGRKGTLPLCINRGKQMNWIAVCMNGGTLLAALATFPQIYAVWKDRNILAGYSPLASAMLCLAMILFGSAFAMMKFWSSVLCEVPVAIFWGLASVYSFKLKRKRT